MIFHLKICIKVYAYKFRMWHFWELKFNQAEALGSLATSALAGAEQQCAQIRTVTGKASGMK